MIASDVTLLVTGASSRQDLSFRVIEESDETTELFNSGVSLVFSFLYSRKGLCQTSGIIW